MSKYIAFLRGINVGGKNKISMSELKVLFEQHGFQNVMTYINSGNVIFSSDSSDSDELKKECEELIVNGLQLKIPVTIVSLQDLTDALSHAPIWWNVDEDAKHNAIFVIPPMTVEEVLNQVGEIKPEYEKVGYYGRIIFWSAPIKTFSRSQWSKVSGLPIYGSITIRNANTVHKLSQLLFRNVP